MTEPKPWTPDEVRTVATALYGASWQTPLAASIAEYSRYPFTQSRIAKWFLAEGGRGIPDWLQPVLTPMFWHLYGLSEDAREKAIQIIEAHSGDQS